MSTLGTAVTGGGSGTSTVRDSVLYGRTGVSTGTSASTLNASRLTVRASHRGASTEGHLSLVNSVIVLQADAEYGLMAGSNADVAAKHLTVVGPLSAWGSPSSTRADRRRRTFFSTTRSSTASGIRGATSTITVT